VFLTPHTWDMNTLISILLLYPGLHPFPQIPSL
jgi:hypothetical protein